MEELQRQIFASLANEDYKSADTYMLHVCNMFSQEAQSSAIESQIHLFCTQEMGVFAYLRKVIETSNYNKLTSISQSIEVIYMLLNNFPKQMEDYYILTIKLCQVVLSSERFTRLKPRCSELFKLIISSKDIELNEVETHSIFSKLKNWMGVETSTVVLSVFIHSIGALAHKNEAIICKQNEIGRLLIDQLKNIPQHRTGKQSLLQGCYDALHEFLQFVEIDDRQILFLYQMLKRDVPYPIEHFQKKGHRSSLLFLTTNSHRFQTLICPDIMFWKLTLGEWCRVENRDDSKAGIEALDAVYKIVGTVWTTIDLNQNLREIIQQFRDALENNKNYYETKIAIRALGYLAPVCSQKLTDKEFGDLFIYLMQRVEFLLLMKSDVKTVVSATTCDYVEAISRFLKVLTTDKSQHINVFKRVAVCLIKLVPKMLPSNHTITIDAFFTIFLSIRGSSFEMFKVFLEDVVKQGILWTCSHSLAQEVEILSVDNVTYKSYLPLWKGLLDNKRTRPKGIEDIQVELYNELMKNLIYTSNKLNLNVVVKDVEGQETVEDKFQAEKINDFVIFANFTDFYCEILSGSSSENFKRWVDSLTSHMIRKSLQQPLVSGFYKLLATCMKMCEDIEFFSDERMESKEHVRMTFENVKNFLEQVLKKVKQHKNDLQLACLLFILHTPVAVIKALNDDFSDIFVSAFKLGQNNFKLATIALETLNVWFKQLNDDVSLPLLKKVVPCLDAYLRNQFVIGDSYQVQGRKLKKYKERKLMVDIEPELVQLQHKVLEFLSMVPTDICLELISTSSELKLNKGQSNLLKVLLPFGERNVSLWMDAFLDRVLILSLECTDRKIRITACELLHSIVAIFLGTSVRMSHSSELDPLLEKLLKALLHLACDQDSTVIDLFNPLLLQLAHWFAHPKQIGSTHSHIFIQVLLDGVNESDCAVRDQAGRILQEFVAWTRKQNSKTQLKNHLFNVQLIIDNLKQFSLHPDETKRFASTIIFNNIYKELREEDIFVDKFFLEILYSFVVNLSLLQTSNNHDELLVQVNLCLDRVMRVLLQKQTLFERVTSEDKRSTPPKFRGNTFEDCAAFLLEYTTHINIHCRSKCIEILNKFPMSVIVKVVQHFNLQLYMHDLQVTPSFTDLKTIEEVFRHFRSLTCFIDAHIFIIRLNPSVGLRDSSIWPCLDYFLANLHTQNLEDVQKILKLPNQVLTRRFKDEFTFIKSNLLERVLELYDVLLTNDVSAFIHAHWLTLLRNYVLNPTALRLVNHTNEAWEKSANKLLRNVLGAIKLKGDSMHLFTLMCKEYITNELPAHVNVEADCSLAHRQLLKGMFILQASDLDIQVLFVKPIDELYKLLGLKASQILKVVPKLKDTQRDFISLKLEIVLDEHNKKSSGAEFHNLLSHLCNEQEIYSSELNANIPIGYYIYLTFKKTIMKYAIKEKWLLVTLTTFAECKPPTAIRYVKEFLKYLQGNKQLLTSKIKAELLEGIELIWEGMVNKVDHEILLELIFELRTVLDSISSTKMFNAIFQMVLMKKPTELQQIHFLTKVVKALGIVAPSGFTPDISKIAQLMTSTFLPIFMLESKRVATTLLIKQLFEATNYSNSLDLFMSALHLYILVPNDFEVDAKFCKEFITRLPDNLQNALIENMFGIEADYNFCQKIIYVLCHCNLLAHCNYNTFEQFYVRYISRILDAFSLDVENKTISCIYLNRLFGNIKTENFESISCPITQAAVAVVQTGKELLQRVAVILLNVCKEEPEPDHNREVFRLYQCHAYNALTTFVCNALKGKQEYYNRLFVRENTEHEDILWCKLISLDKEFNFNITTDEIPNKRKVLVNIRTEITTEHTNEDYIESQNLFLSTLAEDITNYDFTNVSVRETENQQITREQKVLALDLFPEDINNHECMSQICGVIKHMHENEMLPSGKPPKWVVDIGALLIKSTTPVNVRQFLCKVIENSQELLKHYANIFGAGIVRTIVETCTSLNSFATDMIVMLLTSWNSYTPNESDVSSLVHFLMAKLWHDRHDIFKYNVNLLKTLIEAYSTLGFQVPYALIQMLFNEDIECKSNLAPIHIINILLINNISPFGDLIKKLSQNLFKLLKSSHRVVYLASAETAGLIMTFLNEKNHPSLPQFMTALKKKVDEIQKDSIVKFADVLESIVKHCKEFGDDFLTTTFYLIKSTTVDKCKAMYLRVHLKCISSLCNMDQVKKLELIEWLSSANLEVRIITLEIILKVVHFLEMNTVMEILQTMKGIPNTDTVCRIIFADVLIAIYRRFYNSEDSSSKEIIKEVTRQLITGFVDTEEDIRKKVCEFWLENDLIPQNLEAKMIYLLESIYDNENEDIYLPFSNFLLLHGMRNDGEPIFRLPLHKCEFKNYEVTAHWRAQNSSMMPMFTATLQSQEFYLRASQSYNEFDATQMLATQRSSYMETASSLAYSVPSTLQTLKSEFRNPNDFEISQKYKVKKWRFFKDKANISQMHAIREVHKGIAIDEMRKDARKKKEVQVKIYRTYRTGDFPDIQINVDAVVNPLRELAKKDGQIAQLLFKSLFDSVVEFSVDGQFIPRASNAINSIFIASQSYNPTMICAFLHIALEYRKNMTFQPNVIAKVANNSGSLSYGCLLLEEYLMALTINDIESPPKKGIAAEGNNETMHWVRLAELYKNLEEWDVVHGIFKDKMICPTDVVSAIQAEAGNDWTKARDYYAILIRDDYDLNRKDFYFEAFFRCSEELSDWNEVERQCERAVQGLVPSTSTMFNLLWSNDWNRETLLPYYLKSQIRKQDPQQLAEKLHELMQDGAKKEYFRREFADQLAYLNLDLLKIKQAKHYSAEHANNFLNNWKFIKPLYTSIQNKILLNTKNCMEVSYLVKAFEQLSLDNYNDTIENLTQIWRKSNTHEDAVSLTHAETRMTYRDSYIQLLTHKLKTLSIEENDEKAIVQKISYVSFESEVNLIRQALQQKNLPMIRKYIPKNLKAHDNGVLYPVSSLLFSQAALLKAETTGTGRSVKTYYDSLKAFHKCIDSDEYSNDRSLWIPACVHFSHLSQSLYEFIVETDASTVPLEKYLAEKSLETYADLLTYSYDTMRDTLYKLEKDQIDVNLANAFLKLAKVAYTKGVAFRNKYIEFSLKSMKYGCEEALLLFPNLLEVQGLIPVYEALFLDQVLQIPAWMFIRWIPQLLAYMDTEKVVLIEHIIMRLAKEYPNSLIYAYKLSKSKYTYEYEETRGVAQELDKLLDNELVDKMLVALNYVAVPSVIIKTALINLKKACECSEEAFKAAGLKVSHLFNEEEKIDVDSFRGPIYKSVLKNKNKLLSIINSPFDKTTILKKLTEYQIEDATKESVDLVHYSPWLNYFHATDHIKEIEVPGRYLGNCRPLPHYHPKISKFSSDVTVFNSIRRPIRIAIYASDVKEYKFLVKYGEDLRLDQRVQQLFKLMNVILSSDTKCHERKLAISTFEVIPLTGDLGFIQWVEETEIMKSFMEKRCGYRHITNTMDRALGKHDDWINKAGKAADGVAQTYAKAVIKYSKEETTAHFNEVVSMLPWDTLRKSFYNITSDPEMFFALRHTFIKSYAVMCICNWLLGIGDRHLENILLSMNSGQVVGIDFGHAFGSATQQQPVPELVPFRLTPQFINLMLPFKESGLLYQTMVHTLRALRENNEILLSTMNIFMVEPTLDWAEFDQSLWNPSAILNLAKLKFTGANPISIMMEEVQRRSKDTAEVKLAYEECLKICRNEQGLEQENSLGEKGMLNASEQVKCLISQATEPNLLGRMWRGWTPWI